ncbi:hypothetical protein [Yoonia sp.]|uniref:hypothetical protein n=1 Tax=Yoonia sp. TaxID=2212373 RepID=UPI003F6B98C5
MRISIRLITATLAVILAACEDTNRYPVTEEQCGPDDPVLGLDAADCNVAPSGTGIGM